VSTPKKEKKNLGRKLIKNKENKGKIPLIKFFIFIILEKSRFFIQFDVFLHQ
jgi:hypothetical protein